jgi:hypothetical protein
MNTMVNIDRLHDTDTAYTPGAGLGLTGSAARFPDLDDVRGIVSRTLSHAKSLGRDELTQTRAAALAVISVRPDVTFLQAVSAIGRMQAAGAV